MSYLVMVDGNAVCLFFFPSQTECVKAMMLGIQLPSHPMARITPVTIWGGACSIQSMGLVHNKKPRTSTLSPIVLSFSTSFNSKHQLLNGIPLSGLHPQTVLGERLSPRGLTAPVRGLSHKHYFLSRLPPGPTNPLAVPSKYICNPTTSTTTV